MQAVVSGLGITDAAAVVPGTEAKIEGVSLANQTAGLFPEFHAMNLEDVELAILGRSGTMAKEDAQYVAAKDPVVRVPEKLIRADVEDPRPASRRW